MNTVGVVPHALRLEILRKRVLRGLKVPEHVAVGGSGLTVALPLLPAAADETARQAHPQVLRW